MENPICPRAPEESSSDSSPTAAARPALARPPDELNVDELLGALDVLYRASHEHALEGHPWQRPNRARTVIDVWLRASSLEHVKEVLYGGVMEAAARIAGPAPSALARPAWQPMSSAPKDRTILAYLETERWALIEWRGLRDGYGRWHEPGIGHCTPVGWQALPPPPEEPERHK